MLRLSSSVCQGTPQTGCISALHLFYYIYKRHNGITVFLFVVLVSALKRLELRVRTKPEAAVFQFHCEKHGPDVRALQSPPLH